MTVPRPALPDGPWLIVGRGKAGQAAAGLLAGRGPVSLWEEPEVRADGAPAPDGVALVPEIDPRAALERLAPATVIKSPGVPPDQPILAAARERGIEIMDELELGWRAVDRPIVGVTGTNGKSTTCALIHGALAAAGDDVAIAGNTDDGPALSSLAPDPPDRVVLEASSFQLEFCPSLLADVAVLTNVTRDHLHRHGDMDAYAAAKARMFVRGDRVAPAVVVNADDPLRRGAGRALRGARGPGGPRRLRRRRRRPDRADAVDRRRPDGPSVSPGTSASRSPARCPASTTRATSPPRWRSCGCSAATARRPAPA